VHQLSLPVNFLQPGGRGSFSSDNIFSLMASKNGLFILPVAFGPSVQSVPYSSFHKAAFDFFKRLFEWYGLLIRAAVISVDSFNVF
jgi:hypothetical protein